jgi:FkbM family methyltransferase
MSEAKYYQEVGWWFPDYERHLQGWMNQINKVVAGRKAYQYHKYEAALKYVRKSRDICLDIGSHCGTWAYYMARDFRRVECFEPMPLHRVCWYRNVRSKNANLYAYALGDHEGEAYLTTRTPDSSGDTAITPEPTEDSVVVPIKRLDDVELPEGSIDFVKIDCEGYEVFILKGATNLLLKHKPCVIVEQKPETGGPELYHISPRAAVEYLVTLGAKLRKDVQDDFILSW